MPEQNSSFIELEQLGTVALIALALIPSVIWVSKAPTGARMAARTALAAGIIVGIIALENSIDQGANKIVDSI